jgi:hypothetical protein
MIKVAPVRKYELVYRAPKVGELFLSFSCGRSKSWAEGRIQIRGALMKNCGNYSDEFASHRRWVKQEIK